MSDIFIATSGVVFVWCLYVISLLEKRCEFIYNVGENMYPVQMECAKSYGADYIVTRNVSDYAASEVKAIEPKDYVKL